MATKYWVGGNGNWNDGSHWSFSSGGGGGAGEPGITDDAVFDNNSFTGNCFVNITSGSNFNGYGAGWAGCASLYTNGLSGTRKLQIQNSGGTAFVIPGYMNLALTYIPSPNVIISNAYYGISNHSVQSDVSSGTISGSAWYNAESAIGTLQINDGCTVTFNSRMSFGSVLLNPGTLNSNNYDFMIGNNLQVFASTSGLTLGSSNAYIWNLNFGAYTVNVNAGTSTLHIESNVNPTMTFNGYSKTWYDVYFYWYGISTTPSMSITGANTVHNLTYAVSAGKQATINFPASTTTTITGTLTIPDGTSSAKTMIRSSSSGTAATISKSSGLVSATYLDIKDSTATGGATYYAVSSTNSGNNSGWQFRFPKTQTATAYIVIQPTKVQLATAKIAMSVTKIQTAKAQISIRRSKTQTATAAIVESAHIQKTYDYKVYDGSQFLGLLPNVSSQFEFNQDINTLGAQIKVAVGVSPDTAGLASTQSITTEDSDIITTEDEKYLITEGAASSIGVGVTTQTLIKNGNILEVWEYSQYHPNGKRMFRGTMERWEASFGMNQDGILITAQSEGRDMNDFLVAGSPYVNDVSQATQDSTVQMFTSGSTYSQIGQTWKVGSGVSNLGAIDLRLNGTGAVTIKVYAAGVIPSSPTSDTPIGVTTQSINTGGSYQVVQFAFATPIAVTAGQTYFFAVSVASGASIYISYKASNAYADGLMYAAFTSGWNATPYSSIAQASDIYFKTYRNAGATTAVFAAQDPTTGIAKTFMDTYIAQGGRVRYTVDSIEATGLSVPYTFNTQTVRDGAAVVKGLAPSTFYYYVDVGDSILNIKDRHDTPDIIVTKGLHIQALNVVATIENMQNALYFSGGDDGSGFNLYKYYEDATSIGYYGRRIGIKSDSRVTLTDTANAIGTSFINENKDEQFQTSLSIADGTMDVTLIKPGMTIGFRGYGTFVDSLVLQIVRLMYTPQLVTVILGVLPTRTSLKTEQAAKDVLTLQTVANPASPS